MEMLSRTDVHGLDRVSDRSLSYQHRILWLLLVLGSTVMFSYVASYRISYYFSYPIRVKTYLSRSNIMVPKIALCTYFSEGSVEYSGNPSCITERCRGDDWKTLSHEEVLLYLQMSMGFNLTKTGNGGKTLSLMAGFQNFSTMLNNIPKRFDNMEEHLRVNRVKNDLTYFARNNYSKLNNLWTILERLQKIPANMSMDYSKENVLSKMRRFILQPSQVTTCTARFHRKVYNCSKDFSTVLSHGQGCLILQTIEDNQRNFSSLYSTLQDTDNIFFEVKFTNHQARYRQQFFLLLDQNESPAYSMSISQLHPLFKETRYLRIMVDESYDTTYCSQPYHNEECISMDNKHLCLQECFIEKYGCRLLFFEPMFNSHQLCPYIDQAWVNVPGKCRAKCHRPCREMGTSCQYRAIPTSSKDPNIFYFSIRPSKNAVRKVSVEVPLYPLDALLAELGGTVGLFLGASIITVFKVGEILLCITRRFLYHQNIRFIRNENA